MPTTIALKVQPVFRNERKLGHAVTLLSNLRPVNGAKLWANYNLVFKRGGRAT